GRESDPYQSRPVVSAGSDANQPRWRSRGARDDILERLEEVDCSREGRRGPALPHHMKNTSGGASMKIMRRTFAAAAAGAILSAGLAIEAGPVRAQDKVLRFVQNGNLTILDPIQTTAYVTRNHGYLIYDTLFAMD